jgi:hypothetical protein
VPHGNPTHEVGGRAFGDLLHRDQQRDGYSNWTADDGFDVVRNNDFVSLQSDDLRAAACELVLGAIPARLAGSAGIRLLEDQSVYQPPSAPGAMTAVGYHASWGTCAPSGC